MNEILLHQTTSLDGAVNADLIGTMRKEKSAGDLARSSSPEMTLEAMQTATDVDEIADSDSELDVEKDLNDDKRSSTGALDISHLISYSSNAELSEDDDEDDFVELGSAKFFPAETPVYMTCAASTSAGSGSDKMQSVTADTSFDFREYRAWVGASALHRE